MTLVPLRSSLLEPIPHGFFTRDGGVSTGIYASLNCGFGSADDRDAVAENRARVATTLGRRQHDLVTVHQVHGTEVAQVTAAWQPADAPKADGLVTDRPGIVLGVLAADCAPVLLADHEQGVIGAAHAGSRGAREGIVDNVVQAMIGLGARLERIAVAIGPCIGPESYEVGGDFVASFTAIDAANAAYFTPLDETNHSYFDLPRYLADRIRRLGVGAVSVQNLDTVPDENRCFSWRRTSKAGLTEYGRMLSVVSLG
jgi:YfiH family protein